MARRRTREEKYPDTKTFHFYNANPKNKITTDCVIRAISTALEIPYNDVVMEMAELQCRTGLDPSEKKAIDKFLQNHGWTKCKQPKKLDNTKYTGDEFCTSFIPSFCKHNKMNRIVAFIGTHHAVAIIDGVVWDTWNSTRGCIGNYWIEA